MHLQKKVDSNKKLMREIFLTFQDKMYANQLKAKTTVGLSEKKSKHS